jgi:cytidyltransferase-like protein
MADTIRSPDEMRARANEWRRSGLGVAFVPTMGYLHAGHVSLLEAARKRADVLVLSIFVNPTQFGPKEDLSRYPRDLAGDLRKAESAGVDVVFLPEPADMAAIESAAADLPVTVYGIEKASVGDSVSQIYYSPGNETDMALGAALAYPPHDTPVRLILMFESADSASYAAYQKLCDEGKVFPKEVYVASEAGGTAAGD